MGPLWNETMISDSCGRIPWRALKYEPCLRVLLKGIEEMEDGSHLRGRSKKAVPVTK